MKKWIYATAVISLVLVLFSPRVRGQEEEKKILRFEFTPFLDIEVMREGFGPIIRHLGKTIGVKTVMTFSPDYVSMTEDLKDGYVDVAWFAPAAYVIAKKSIEDLRIIATLTENGKSYYEGFIIARKDSGISSLDGLKGKIFGFVDVGSSSGYVYPRAMLLGKGINPVEFFEKALFLGNHNNVIDAVYNKEIDAGATYDAAFYGAGKRGVDLNQFIIIAKTDPIPQDAICVRSGLDEETTDKLRQALLQINKEGTEKFSIKGYKEIGFTPGKDSDYDVVRRAAAYK